MCLLSILIKYLTQYGYISLKLTKNSKKKEKKTVFLFFLIVCWKNGGKILTGPPQLPGGGDGSGPNKMACFLCF